MPDTTEPVRAPQGAIGWTPALGWVYDVAELPTRVEDGHYVLVVSERDGMVRGVTGTTTAPLTAVLRIDADLTELMLRLHDVAEYVADRLAATLATTTQRIPATRRVTHDRAAAARAHRHGAVAMTALEAAAFIALVVAAFIVVVGCGCAS